MPINIVTIDLLGTSFTVQTDESPEYMETLLARLRERLNALRGSTRVADPLKLSILVNITLLDELLRERSRIRQDGEGAPEDEISRLADRLIADLDRSLESNEG
jgi:cell division protein ZapA (FtsZ GTPase activity inhibitor)